MHCRLIFPEAALPRHLPRAPVGVYAAGRHHHGRAPHIVGLGGAFPGSISREHFQEARCSRYTAHIFSPTVGIFLSIGHGSGAEAERWDSSYTGEGGGIQGNEVEVLRSSNLKALDHMQVFVTEEP